MQLLLLGHTHHDVGYTNSPRLIDRQHGEIVREVLRLVAAEPGDGPDAFRWTFEVARPVLTFLAQADDGDRRALVDGVASGRLSVTSGLLNMTQLAGEAELDRGYDALQPLRELGIPIRTQQHGDVNGLSWGTVEAMQRAGVERLVMALNPDHGRPPLPQPSLFRWRGHSGAEVLTLLSTHYGVGEEWGIVDGDLPLAEASVASFVADLERREDYPYEVAVVHAGNDNRWPTATFCELVRYWNERHPEHPMRTATIDQAMDAFSAQAALAPVLTGEWADWWSHGHGSAAADVAIYRSARSYLGQAAAFAAADRMLGTGAPPPAAVLGHRRGPVRLRTDVELAADLADVDADLLLYAEHTFGSWETYRSPDSAFTRSHHSAKAGFAHRAYDLARDLAIETASRLTARPGAPEVAGVLVANPTTVDRREPVTVELPDGHQRYRRAPLVVHAPALTSLVVPVPPPPQQPWEPGDRIEGNHWHVRAEPGAGVVGLYHPRTGRDLLEASSAVGMGALVAEIFDDATHPVLTDPKRFRPEDPGPAMRRVAARGGTVEVRHGEDWQAIRWEGEVREIGVEQSVLVRVYDDHPALDVEVTLVKPARLAPESLHLAFPFAIPQARFLAETAGAVFEVDDEQLPDTSRDWLSVQHAIAVLDDGDEGLLWESLDAPLVQLGRLRTGEWVRAHEPQPGHVYSWVANNLHFTNFPAQQDAGGTYRYRISPLSGPDPRGAVRRAGALAAAPLHVRPYEGPWAPAPAPVLVEPADEVAVELSPTPDGGVRARVRNLTGLSVTCEVRLAPGWGLDGGGRLELPPHGALDCTIHRT